RRRARLRHPPAARRTPVRHRQLRIVFRGVRGICAGRPEIRRAAEAAVARTAAGLTVRLKPDTTCGGPAKDPQVRSVRLQPDFARMARMASKVWLAIACLTTGLAAVGTAAAQEPPEPNPAKNNPHLGNRESIRRAWRCTACAA